MKDRWIGPYHKLIQYSGRIDNSNELGPILVYPTSGIKIRFTGSYLKVLLFNKNQYWDNYLGVIIDGQQDKILLTNNKAQVITVAKKIEAIEHTAFLFKRMDSCHTLQIMGFSIEEGETLLACEKEPERRIEFYGDSVTAGEVSEAIEFSGKKDPVHNGEYSNSWYSYASITARKLNARIHNISQGGIALLNNTGWFYESNYIGMESIYDKISYHPLLGEITNWDFSRYIPHVVVIAIGQNDSHPYDYMREDYYCEMAKHWRKRYKEFVQTLRSIYPLSFIILSTSILEHHRNWDDSIEAVCEELNDEKIVHFLYSNNGRGTKGHIRIDEATKMAEELSSYIIGFGDALWKL